MIPLLSDTILHSLIRSVNRMLRCDLDHPVSLASILFFIWRQRRLACTHLLRPWSQPPPWLQRKNMTLYPLTRLCPWHTQTFFLLEMQLECVPAAVASGVRMAIGVAAVQKYMVPVFTSMLILSCSATRINGLRPVRFIAFFVTKTASSNIPRSGQNLRSSGSNGAKLGKNVWRSLSELRNASICV